jgi:hypothetical protein
MPLLRTRVHADERPELDVDLKLLAGLAPRRVLDGLAELDVAAGERPAPGALVQRAAQQPDPALLVTRDRGRDRLWAPERVVAAALAAQLARERDLGRGGAARAEPDVL